MGTENGLILQSPSSKKEFSGNRFRKRIKFSKACCQKEKGGEDE